MPLWVSKKEMQLFFSNWCLDVQEATRRVLFGRLYYSCTFFLRELISFLPFSSLWDLNFVSSPYLNGWSELDERAWKRKLFSWTAQSPPHSNPTCVASRKIFFDKGPPIFENPPLRMIDKKYGLSFIQSLLVVFKKVTIVLFKRRCFIVWGKLYVRHRMLQKTMINHVGAPGGVFKFQNKTTHWKWWGCWKNISILRP